MMSSFGCCRADVTGASQSANHWKSYKVWEKMGAGEMEDDKCMVMEVEGAWNLAGMGMFSCLRAGIGMSVCVLVLVVVAVFAIVLGR